MYLWMPIIIIRNAGVKSACGILTDKKKLIVDNLNAFISDKRPESLELVLFLQQTMTTEGHNQSLYPYPHVCMVISTYMYMCK